MRLLNLTLRILVSSKVLSLFRVPSDIRANSKAVLKSFIVYIYSPLGRESSKLVSYFARKEEEVINQKNDIIARCLLDVLFSGKSPSMIRNKFISILTKFSTRNLNLDVSLVKGGWTRTIRQCLFVEAGRGSDDRCAG